MRTTARIPKLLLTALSTFALLACSKEPLECGAPQTAATVKEIIASNVRKAAAAKGLTGEREKEMAGYYESIGVDLQNVVMDGYDAVAKKRSCRAQFKVSFLPNLEIDRNNSYSIQLTDKEDSYITIDDAQPIIEQVSGNAATYWLCTVQKRCGNLVR